jgi:hypothetical protein
VEIVQTRDWLVQRAVVAMSLVKVNRSRIDADVVEHRAQRLAWAVAEYLARDHHHLSAVEVIEKRRKLKPVEARPEVPVVEQGYLGATPLAAG